MSLGVFDRSAINADLYDFSDPDQLNRFCEAANLYNAWLMLCPTRTSAEEQTLMALKNILDDDNVFPRVQQSATRLGLMLTDINQSRVFGYDFDTPQGWLLRKLFNRLTPEAANPGLTFKEHLSLRMHLTELEWRTSMDTNHLKPGLFRLYRTLKREWSVIESNEAREQSGEAAEKKETAKETETQGNLDWSTF